MGLKETVKGLAKALSESFLEPDFEFGAGWARLGWAVLCWAGLGCWANWVQLERLELGNKEPQVPLISGFRV